MAKGPGFQPIPGITPKRPVPSLLTSARALGSAALPRVPLPGESEDVSQILQDWRSGISWRSIACAPGYRWPFCQDDSEAEKEDPPTIVKPTVYPYAIYVPFQCAWGTPDDLVQFRKDSMAQLDAVTPWHVSRELWTGATEPLNDSLQSVAVDVSASAAVHPVTALGSLLEAYFDCPPEVDGTATGAGSGQPLVHAPLSIITSLLANHVIAQQGDYYVGPGGCIVSSGPGYPTGHTSAPTHQQQVMAADAITDEDAWMYVSGPVEYALGDITVLDDNFDRRSNLYEAKPERLAIARFDPCCVFAVAVYQPSPSDSATV